MRQEFYILGMLLVLVFFALASSYAKAKREQKELLARLSRVSDAMISVEARTWTLALNYVIDEMNKKVAMGDIITSEFLNLQAHFRAQQQQAEKNKI